jgi:hypothetical protein
MSAHFLSSQTMVEAEMTEQEQRELDLTVADIFANDPTVTIAKVAQQLGRTRWEIRVACFRAGIPLKVGRPRKIKVS